MLIRKLRLSFSLFPFALLLVASTALAQDRASDQGGIRGNRAEIVVTIKEGSSQLIGPLVTVKLYYLGTLSGQMTTSKGRAVFILNSLGDYIITADAIGYRSAQKEISVPVAVEAEEEIILQRDSTPEALGAAARPLLAPKAKEAFDKGLQAINENKLADAEKYVAEAMKLAPGHPDVLFIQGILYLSLHNWTLAQGVLEKCTQIDPTNARAFAALGMAFTNEGKYEEAITPLEKSLQMEAGGWETHWALGKAYYYRQQYSQALKTSQLALTESNGKAPQIELLVAQSLTAVGRYDDAAQTLREFLKSHGDRPEAATARRWLAGLANSGKIRQN